MMRNKLPAKTKSWAEEKLASPTQHRKRQSPLHNPSSTWPFKRHPQWRKRQPKSNTYAFWLRNVESTGELASGLVSMSNLQSSVLAERFCSTIHMKIATASVRFGVLGGLWSAGRRVSCRQSVRARTRGSMVPPMEPDLGLSLAGRVLSIQSHTVHGYVGNKAAVFPLQLLGFDVDPINSVQFSNHTGYATIKGHVLDGEQLWTLIEGLHANDLLHYTHLLTGYIGSVSFLETVLRVVEKLRTVNPNLIYVCDPVMGDDGEFYVNPELVPVYRQKVVSVATMLTPNQFEAEQLTGRRIETEAEALAACIDLHAAGPSKVVITSLSIDNMLTIVGSHVQSRGKAPKQFKITVPRLHSYFTGTGDLMTALLLGWSHKFPDDLDKAAELAVSSLQAVLNNTIADYITVGASPEPRPEQLELRLIQSIDDIRSPTSRFLVEKL